MRESRRRLLMTFVGVVGVLAAGPAISALQAQGRQSPRAKPYPNGRDPNLGPEQDPPRALDPKAIELANKQELKKDVAKLYEMVSKLKDQVDKMDATSTLSVSVVKMAQQIEKLAKQIKDLAKG
jgi:hypothetical protein